MVMASLLMSSMPISISHPLFRCKYTHSRDVVVSCPSFCCPAARAPQRACLQAQAIVLDDSRVIYRESKIGNDFFWGGGEEMEDFTGPKVPIEWLNFTAAQSAKVSNSGTQDGSPVWGTENQIGNEFFGKMVDFVSFLFKSGSCWLTLEALQLTQRKIPQSPSH